MKLRRARVDEALQVVPPIQEDVEAGGAIRIVDGVRARGEAAVRERMPVGERLVYDREAIEAGAQRVDDRELALLQRTAQRLRLFAAAQRRAVTDVCVPVAGGHAGHTVEPVERAGCLVSVGGRARPSAVLMTAVTARAAGVRDVWVAAAHPDPTVFAAAHAAGVDAILGLDGPLAVGALAFGAGSVPRCAAIVGPCDAATRAAKRHVAGFVQVDVLDGPNELVILADGSADARLVAADLLAQAEHAEGLPMLVSLDERLVARVESELEVQLATLPDTTRLRRVLERGFAIVEPDVRKAIEAIDRIAPAHLQLMLEDTSLARYLVRHCGTIFVGAKSAEAFGDYGAGPNYVLPTARGSRARGGLSVCTFLRVRTWLEVTDPAELAADAARFARLEGFEAHARAAEMRT